MTQTCVLRLHLIETEKLEHRSSAPLDQLILKCRNEVLISDNIQTPGIRYHYDVYKELVAQLSSQDKPTCSSRLRAAGQMFLIQTQK